MELIAPRYQVGQRLRHPQFGEGLVVEVHTDRGREVLEVVFDGQLRRLSAQREWELVAERWAHAPLQAVGPGVKTGIQIRYDDPREVGPDRIVNAVAACERYGPPVIVVDFGTSTNFDIVSPAGEYVGGVLARGI